MKCTQRVENTFNIIICRVERPYPTVATFTNGKVVSVHNNFVV